MAKKAALLLAGGLFLAQAAAWAQRNVIVNQSNQMRGGRMDQFRMGMQISPEEMLKFLKGQQFTEEAQKLEGLMKDPSKGQELQQELGRLNRVYGMVIRQMEFDPEGAQRTLARIKLETEIEKFAREARTAAGAAQTAARKKLASEVGKLFDAVLAEEEMRLQQMEEFIRTGDISAFGAMGAMMGRAGGTGRGAQMGMAGQMNPEMMKQQLAQRRADIAAWKKNKTLIVNMHVQELLLDIPPFPWTRGGMQMMRIFE